MRMPTNIEKIVMAVWFLLFGVLTAPFLKISFAYSGDVLAVLAIVLGVLLLLRAR